MSYASDDLVPLLAPPPQSGLGFRQGVILTWDQTTAENTIQVAGATLTNLSVLNTSEAQLLSPGDVVGILTAGPSWFIMGRITVPATPAAATALSLVSNRITSDQVSGTVATSSSTFQSLSGPVVSNVRIGPSGKALVMVGASVNYVTTNNLNTEGGYAGVAVSGATTISAGFNAVDEAFNLNATATVNGQLSFTTLIEGLNPGLHTFTHQVCAFTSGRSCNFSDRILTVFAL